MSNEAELSILIRLKDEATAMFKKVGASMKSAADFIKNSWMNVSTFFKDVFEGIKKGFELIEAGAKAQAIEGAFDRMAASVGVDGEKMKRAIDDAAGATANFSNIAPKLTQMLSSGLGMDTVVALMKQARAEARITGDSVEEDFNKISQAIESGAVKSLKAMGLNVDLTRAIQDYANATGKTTDEVQRFYQQQALANAVLQAGKQHLDIQNLSMKTAWETVQEFNNRWDDLKEKIGQALIKIVEATTDSIDLKTAFEKAQTGIDSATDALVSFLNELKPTIESLKELKPLLSFLYATSSPQALFGAMADKIAPVTGGAGVDVRMPAVNIKEGGAGGGQDQQTQEESQRIKRLEEIRTLGEASWRQMQQASTQFQRQQLQERFDTIKQYMQMERADKIIDDQWTLAAQQNFTAQMAQVDDAYFVAKMNLQQQELQAWAQAHQMQFEIMQGTVGAMTDVFSSFMNDAIAGTLKNGVEYFKAFGQAILQILIQVIAKLIVAILLEAIASSFFGGVGSGMAKIHAALSAQSALMSGGILGSHAMGTSFIPETGPYLLHRGEEVLSRNESQKRQAPQIVQNIQPTIIVNAMDGQSVLRMARQIGAAVTSEIKKNGTVRGTILQNV